MRQRPVAITDGATVLARNRRAVEAGVAVGMKVTEAVTHAADLLLAPDDSHRTQALWDVVLDQLDSLGPVVEDAGLGLALVDLTGVGRNERGDQSRWGQSRGAHYETLPAPCNPVKRPDDSAMLSAIKIVSVSRPASTALMIRRIGVR